MRIQLVALDADDTLWHNEPLFRSTQDQFRDLLSHYHAPAEIDAHLTAVERRNLQHFGYGVKGFVLSMIETGLELTENRLDGRDVCQILEWGRAMIASPVHLLEGARETVEELARRYRLILLTKGDLFHQESKLARSGLAHWFSGVEVVSEKDSHTYRTVMARYAVAPEDFVMVGNSLKSDVLPVVEAGGHAVHVPYAMTWTLEHVDPSALSNVVYDEIATIAELTELLRRLEAAGSPAMD